MIKHILPVGGKRFFPLFIIITVIIGASQMSCKTTKDLTEVSVEKTAASRIFSDKLIATVKPGVAPTTLEKRFEKYTLAYRGLTSKSQNKMMFTFDDSMISNDDMRKLLEKDDDIVATESLKETTRSTSAKLSSDKKTALPIK